jgi:hypothetical protein
VLTGAFSSAQYNEFLKGKLWEIVETAGLLSIFSLAFVGLNNYGVGNIDKARAYSSVIYNTVLFDFSLMLAASMATGFIVNLNPQFKIPGASFISVGLQISPMFKPIIDILNLTMQLITTAIGIWGGQAMLLCFTKSSMLAILLPLGFFLRALGVKGGGNTLIGIALAMYFAYPFLITMIGDIITSHIEKEIQSAGTPHLWGTCTDKPICCALPGAEPSSVNDPDFIPNGALWNDPNPAIAVQYRLKTGVLINTPFVMAFDQTQTGGKNVCMYNSVLARAYKAVFGDIVNQLSTWGMTGGVIGAAAFAKLFASLNLSWMLVFLIIPLSFFIIQAAMEMVYFVFIATIILPFLVLFITLTLAREIAKSLGTEIDLSALEKLI